MAWAVRAASDQRVAGLLWRALGTAGSLDQLGPDRARFDDMAEAFRMEGLLLLPRGFALAVTSAHRRRTRAGRLQGPGGGGALPRTGPASDG